MLERVRTQLVHHEAAGDGLVDPESDALDRGDENDACVHAVRHEQAVHQLVHVRAEVDAAEIPGTRRDPRGSGPWMTPGPGNPG